MLAFPKKSVSIRTSTVFLNSVPMVSSNKHPPVPRHQQRHLLWCCPSAPVLGVSPARTREMSVDIEKLKGFFKVSVLLCNTWLVEIIIIHHKYLRSEINSSSAKRKTWGDSTVRVLHNPIPLTATPPSEDCISITSSHVSKCQVWLRYIRIYTVIPSSCMTQNYSRSMRSSKTQKNHEKSSQPQPPQKPRFLWTRFLTRSHGCHGESQHSATCEEPKP